jgi:hypothetical protein
VYALQKYDFIVLFPINPATLARYRQAFKPSGAKDDPTDAELAWICWCAIATSSRPCGHRALRCAP